MAGFSGIVAAVGRRGSGHWTEVDQLRLRILLTASGVALLFAFLPFVLVDLIDPSLMWRLASGLLAAHTIFITACRFRQASVAGIRAAIGFQWFRMTAVVIVVSMLLVNAFWLASSSLYILGVLWGLFVAFLMFVSLLLEAWREPPGAAPAA